MHKLRRIDVKRGKEIAAEIKAFAEKIAARRKIKKIFLFGSFARGDYSEASDIDLLVVGDFKERFLDRSIEIERQTKLPAETFCYTEKEFENMRKAGNPFIKEAIKGKLLYSA